MHSSDELHVMYGSTVLPTYIQFETNTLCGATCKMCPRSKMTPRREMTWGELARVIDAVAPYAENLCPFLIQEPSREKRLPQILSYIKQVNPKCKTIIYSNMSQWTPMLTDKLLDRGTLDELYISFYAPTREHYKHWQPGLDYDKVKANILYFLEQNKGDIFVAFNYIAIDDLIGEGGETVKKFIDEWKNYAPVRIVHYDTMHGTMPLYGDNSKHFKPSAPHRTPCSRIWGVLNIHSTGDVVPCCGDYDGEVVFGNINESPVKDIWCNEKFESFRQLHIDGKQDEIPLCRDCTVWRHQESDEWVNLWMNK